MDKLALVREFWNETPCDGHATYQQRAQFRYGKEPWLPAILQRVAASHRHVLEVGCGQGTDGVTLCLMLPPDGSYIGVDMSEASLANAAAAAGEVRRQLRVQPEFRLVNAERLPFADDTFECVVSVGALHHSSDTRRAIDEVRRVLRPGGVAYVFLYRTLSPKLLASHALRLLQRGLDVILRTDRVLYRTLRASGVGNEAFGTMLHECFGVPILRSYTRGGIRDLFAEFSSAQFTAYCVGLPPVRLFRWLDFLRTNPLGYLWLAEAHK